MSALLDFDFWLALGIAAVGALDVYTGDQAFGCGLLFAAGVLFADVFHRQRAQKGTG